MTLSQIGLLLDFAGAMLLFADRASDPKGMRIQRGSIGPTKIRVKLSNLRVRLVNSFIDTARMSLAIAGTVFLMAGFALQFAATF